MQGQRSVVGSFPDLSFHNDSATSDSGIDPQRCWNNMLNPAQENLSDCISSSNESVPYLNPRGYEGHTLGGWDLGESSSSVSRDQVHRHEQVSVYTGDARVIRGMQHGSLDILSLNNAEMNTELAANGHLFMQNPLSSSIPQDQYASSEFSGRDDDDCQIIECPSAYKSGSSNDRLPGISCFSEPCATPSVPGGYLLEESDSRPSCSLSGRRLSCKRKTIEGSGGQSSGNGCSYPPQDGESRFWHTTASHHNMTTGILSPPGNNIGINLPEQLRPRPTTSVGRAASDVPHTLTASASADSSSRNFRVRINGSHQQDYVPGNFSSTQTTGGSSNVLSGQHSLSHQPNRNSMNLGPFSASDNGSAQRQSVALHVDSLRQNPHSGWYRASTSGASSSRSAFSGERDAVQYERSIPRRNISEHPMFLPAIEMGNLSQSPGNWSLVPGNINIALNAGSTSHAGLSSGVNSATPLVSNRNPPQCPRRISEFVCRPLLSSTTSESGNQNSSYSPVHLAPASSWEIAHPLGSGHHGHRRFTRSAVLLERQLGNAVGFPYLGHTFAASSEGRNRLVSEIRNVLDLMRRGEGLRFEDIMVLDQSVFFGMAEIDDRHRDMRLDVDNMSYEELLALEERIGNVCTGLNEETITTKLKQRKYVGIKTEQEGVAEPCCVCQEEYKDGEDLGTLECGHDFHTECIKQWLMQKNLCPICKTTGLTK